MTQEELDVLISGAIDDIGVLDDVAEDVSTEQEETTLAVEEKASEIFIATKLTWLNEIEKYERKFEDYFRFKQNAYSKIQIDNIRESKLKSLEMEKQVQREKFQLQRNIVPKLELSQIAYVEFL